jgi:flagellin
MLNIITNTASMSASRALNRNQKALAQSFQRLSTGLRINSAKDDAAGLAISNRLTAQFRGLNQAARNASDSMSMLQTAESAIAEQQDMVQRLRELAVQAASDSNTATDRAALQAEADALVSEIDRIAEQTSYNGRNLLDGTLSDVSFQVGANEDQSVSLTLSGTRGSNLGAMYTSSGAVTADALTTGDVTIGGVAVRATTADDDTVSSADNTSSAIAKAAAINEGTADHGVTAEVQATQDTGTAITAGTLGASGDLVINGVDVFDQLGAVAWTADDAGGDLRDAINSLTSQTGVTASLDGSNQLVLTAEDGRNLVVSHANDGANSGMTAQTTYGGIELRSEEAFTVGGNNPGYIGAGNGTASATNINTLNLSSQSGANDAIQVLDDAIGQLNGRQADIGALMNRMDYAVSNLEAAAENVASARSRIRDADFAAETAAFSKNQILQQASASMLAQANVQSQLALQLLG